MTNKRDDPKTLKVINLWAASGAGKSTTAAGLFNLMKVKGISCELVTEYAKDLTWAKNYGDLRHQLAILGEQDRRLRRLVGQVEFAITDSPLPLGLAYMTPEYEDWLPGAIKGAYERYDNHDFFILRTKPYVQAGRNQTESEALALDITIRGIFNDFTGGADPSFVDQAMDVVGDIHAPYAIARALGVTGRL